MPTVYLSLGSNLGKKKENIERAISFLKEKGIVKKISSFYKTEPVDVRDQPWFVNCVVEAETVLSPEKLLVFTQSIEKRLKKRILRRKGPRTIDIDILFYDNKRINKKNITIPHPRLHNRNFVVIPFCEINPHFVHPVLKKTMADLCNEENETQKIIKIKK